ncbi:hypothetical protein CE91St41_39880 [Oscillospiraceae bacterium]|nr:hypothetical protein CE91St40_39850 [Oscillospiraceae bacterium]BDF77099.1 hypothetical protein CE91St41_39880 [Oscillospiraceae bacterium]
MQTVRVVEIPGMKAAFSGPLSSKEAFERFNTWFSRFHAAQSCELYPRDFMWYNERLGVQEWFYALPANCDPSEITDFEIVDLPSGLYAAASCLNADLDAAKDWLSTREEIIAWVEASGSFELYRNGEGRAERYPMFHIVSPGWMMPMGISVEDLYVPIVTKGGGE